MKNKTVQVNKSKSCWCRWLWRIIMIAAAALIGIGILVKYQPRTYRPLHPEYPQQPSHYLVHQLGPAFYNPVQYDQPFELIVEQAGINDIISRWPWPEQIGQMTFSDPVISFLDGTVILMGNLGIKDISSVVTVIASPAMMPDGQLNLNIQSVRLGMMPVTTLIGKLAQEAFNMNLDAFSEDPQAAAIVKAIIDNEPFDPVFEILDRRVQVTGFSLKQGVLKLNLSPGKLIKPTSLTPEL